MRQEINKALYGKAFQIKAHPLSYSGRCMLERHTASVFWALF